MEITFEDEKGVKYRSNPVRDIAYFLPQLMLYAGPGTEPDTYELAVLAAAGETADDFKRAAAHLDIAFDLARRPECKDIGDAVAGLTKCKPASRQLVLVRFGRVAFGACWAGVRSAVMEDECPAVLDSLCKRGQAALEALAEKG